VSLTERLDLSAIIGCTLRRSDNIYNVHGVEPTSSFQESTNRFEVPPFLPPSLTATSVLPPGMMPQSVGASAGASQSVTTTSGGAQTTGNNAQQSQLNAHNASNGTASNSSTSGSTSNKTEKNGAATSLVSASNTPVTAASANHAAASNNNVHDPMWDFEEEPRYEPVNGIVQPPTTPGPDRPCRNTNQLQFLLKVVMKVVSKHQFAWPFTSPVDTIKLRLPDYHKIIPHPMDLGTIRKRLENCFYYSAAQCIHDFKTMFSNCYTYNKPGEDVVLMAQTLEKIFLSKLQDMPKEEIDLPMPSKGGKGRKGKKGGPRGRGMQTLMNC